MFICERQICKRHSEEFNLNDSTPKAVEEPKSVKEQHGGVQ